MSKFCPSCGKELEDNAQFCDGCGAAQQAETTEQPNQQQQTAPPPPNAQQAAPVQGPAQEGYTADDIQKNKSMAALAYIIFFLPLIVCPDSKYGRYHANQGLLVLIASIAGGIVLAILSAIFTAISYYLIFLGSLLYTVFYIAIVVLVIIGIMNAVNGKAKPLPVIGKLFTIIK